MYCELFRLKEPPFRLTPDPQFLFASKQHARAKAYMESTIWLADGFVVITGDIGSGKTTLIESFLAELGGDIVIAHVNQTQLSPVEFLQALLVEFGFRPFKMQKIELLTMLRDHMVQQYAAGKKILLVVDEAQNLSRQVLEEVRMLSGIEAQKEKLLRIILAGQPELAEKLDSPRLEQLTQRVRLRFHLGSLSKRETRDYIEHRLRVAGADRAIFSDDAFDIVFRYSGGVPRLTNILCDTAMLCAFAEERDTVDASLVKAAIEELQWVEYAERVRGRERREITGRHPRMGARGPSLDLLFHDELVSNYSLPPGRAIIGRTPDNDVQIQSKFISRHHAQVVTQGDRCVIEDLNSTNGIFFGSKRIKQHVLADGDVIQIGEHKLLFRAGRTMPREDSDTTIQGDDTHRTRFDGTESDLVGSVAIEGLTSEVDARATVAAPNRAWNGEAARASNGGAARPANGGEMAQPDETSPEANQSTGDGAGAADAALAKRDADSGADGTDAQSLAEASPPGEDTPAHSPDLVRKRSSSRTS